jgi:sugar (pentulose or hexulose) kinase
VPDSLIGLDVGTSGVKAIAISPRSSRSRVTNAMKKGLHGLMLRVSSKDEGGPHAMLYAGLHLSRKGLDFHLLEAAPYGGRST